MCGEDNSNGCDSTVKRGRGGRGRGRGGRGAKNGSASNLNGSASNSVSISNLPAADNSASTVSVSSTRGRRGRRAGSSSTLVAPVSSARHVQPVNIDMFFWRSVILCYLCKCYCTRSIVLRGNIGTHFSNDL